MKAAACLLVLLFALIAVGQDRSFPDIPENHSLKGKRGVLKSVQARVANQFNVSVTECGDHDLWQSAILGFAVAGTSQPIVEATLNKVVDFVEALSLAQLNGAEVECFHC